MSTNRVELRINAINVEDDTVILCVSRERLAMALLGNGSETSPIVLHEAWGNGDSAKVIIKRISWQETDWRETAQGAIKGPYRVWTDNDRQCYVECKRIALVYRAGPFATEEEAKQAAMDHAGMTWGRTT